MLTQKNTRPPSAVSAQRRRELAMAFTCRKGSGLDSFRFPARSIAPKKWHARQRLLIQHPDRRSKVKGKKWFRNRLRRAGKSH